MSQFLWVRSLACFSWVLCSGSRRAEIKFSLAPSLRRGLFQVHSSFWQIHFLAVVWLRPLFPPFLSKLLTRDHSHLWRGCSQVLTCKLHSRAIGSLSKPPEEHLFYCFPFFQRAHLIRSGPPGHSPSWSPQSPVIKDLNCTCNPLWHPMWKNQGEMPHHSHRSRLHSRGADYTRHVTLGWGPWGHLRLLPPHKVCSCQRLTAFHCSSWAMRFLDKVQSIFSFKSV